MHPTTHWAVCVSWVPILHGCFCWLQEEAQAGVEVYAEALTQHYEEGMARKLGLKAYDRDVAVGFMKLLFDDTGEGLAAVPLSAHAWVTSQDRKSVV